MKKWLYILILHCAFFGVLVGTATPMMAEEVVLQSGKVLRGQIMMQNDEIVLLQDAEGRRYQLLQTDIEDIHAEPTDNEQVLTTEEDNSKGKVALRIDLNGAAVFVPTVGAGGGGAMDLQIGTRHIAGRSIFLGGGVGYQFSINHFLPLTAVVSVPLTEGRHAPELGAALGYAFALKQPSIGGLHARLDCSWRYQYSETSALLLGVQARFQQTQLNTVETIEGKEYVSLLGHNIVSIGLRLAFIF